ncbi:Uncharacterised protein [Kluyvera cryocrescens]|nr:Uncharacterised protein [Kluyvera cryocrescens]
MFDSDFVAKAIAAGFAVPHFKLVIVVPGGVDTLLQQLLGHTFLPPGHGFRVGEVEVRTLIVPEAGSFRTVAFGVADKEPALGHFLIARVILQQTRLDVGSQMQPRIVECLAHDLRLRHFVVVPVKDVALAVYRGVAGRELE